MVRDVYAEYDRLIAPLERKMLDAVWSVARNADDAEEALREALAVIWRKWDRIVEHPNPEALVIRICLNAAYDVLRRKGRRLRRETPIGEENRGMIDARAVQTPSPREAAALREQESAVLYAIGQLSRNQAAAVIMRLVQGHSYGDIAQALGCKDVTVRKHIERGRERLRQLLQPFLMSQTRETTP